MRDGTRPKRVLGVSSSTASDAPSVVAAPSERAPSPASKDARRRRRTAPSLVPATPEQPPASAAEQRTQIALPERRLIPEPPPAASPARQRAIGKLKRTTLLTREERVATLRKLPGIGAMADDVARDGANARHRFDWRSPSSPRRQGDHHRVEEHVIEREPDEPKALAARSRTASR
jgi:hypothetical protein